MLRTNLSFTKTRCHTIEILLITPLWFTFIRRTHTNWHAFNEQTFNLHAR